jgi:hypothetical protein
VRTGNRPKRDKKTPKQSKPLRRKIHLGVGADAEVWTYDINSNGVRIRTPDGEGTYNISHQNFVGWWPDRDSKAEILPSDIVGYIRREYLGTDPDWKYQYYHRNHHFAEKHGIDMLKTTSRKLNAMIEAQEAADAKEKARLKRHRIHLAMENIDLLLGFTDHSLTTCSDEEPIHQGKVPEWGKGRIECLRCYLLYCKGRGKWDNNYNLHLVALRNRD